MKRSPWLAWALLVPTLVPLLVFVVYPALESLRLSFREVDVLSRHDVFVGLANYGELLGSPEYWSSLWVSVSFMLMTVLPSIAISLAVALALDAKPWFQSFFRTVFLLPVAVSSAMAAMLWIFIYNPTAGYLNYALNSMHLSGPNWLGDPRWALAAVAIATVWKEMGFNVIFFVAGLASVPPELREAAVLDGAGPWARFRNVTLPMLSPTFFFVAVVSVINSFQSFGQIHVLTRGGPSGATNTLVYSLYLDAFEHFRTGYASAQAVILFVILFGATMIQFRIAKRRVHYG